MKAREFSGNVGDYILIASKTAPRRSVASLLGSLADQVDALGREPVGHRAVEAVVKDAALDDVDLAGRAVGKCAVGRGLEANGEQLLAVLGGKEQLVQVRQGQAGRGVGELDAEGAVGESGLG